MTTNFGMDTWCQDSMRTGRYARGPLLVAQNVYHRLITPRGMLVGGEDEANYGVDLLGLIGQPDTSAAALEAIIAAEIRKDERVASVLVKVTMSRSGASTTATIDVFARTAEGPFTLQIGVEDVTIELLKITAEAA